LVDNSREGKIGGSSPGISRPQAVATAWGQAGLVGPATRPGTRGVFISVGKRDAATRIPLSLKGDDAQRRYRLGAITIEDGKTGDN